MATIDNGLSFGEESMPPRRRSKTAGQRALRQQTRPRHVDDLLNYWAMAEAFLWPAKDRRVPWRDLLMRAKTDPTWPWMPGSRGWSCCATRPSSKVAGVRHLRAT